MGTLLYGPSVDADVASVLLYMDGFAKSAGIKTLEVDLAKLTSVMRGIRQDFPHKDGVEKASVFKKAANFIVNFVAERPIVSQFPASAEIDPGLLKLANHENAVIAFEVACDSLHGATVRRSDGEVVLKNHISVSGHSYIDIIEALASVSPSQHFHCVAVLLEQLAYRANPECSYSCMK